MITRVNFMVIFGHLFVIIRSNIWRSNFNATKYSKETIESAPYGK